MRLLLILCGFLISSCSSLDSMSVQDGAPTSPKPVTHVTEEKPKAEKLSRYGNPAIYRVKGKRYKILKNARGYEEKGIASWYGTKFHKKRTSSGETYDMYAMTAAHKTLPLPSYVEVINTDNQRAIIVRVNDRGPFHDDRLIDLSYTAAKRLGILAKGTGQVLIKAITPAINALNHHFLQVAAYKRQTSATTLADHLESTIPQYPVLIEQKNNTFLVQLGPIENYEASQTLKSELKQLGYPNTFSLLKQHAF